MLRFSIFIWLIISFGITVFPKSAEDRNIKDLVEKAVAYSFFRMDSLQTVSDYADSCLFGSDLTLADSAGIVFIIGIADKKKGERKLAEINFRKALGMAVGAKDEKLQNQIKLQLAKYLREERNFLESGKLLTEALSYFRMMTDSLNTFYSYKEIGQSHFEQGRNTLALNNYIAARQIIPLKYRASTEAEVNKLIGSAYLNLAELFSHISTEKSVLYYKESMRYSGLAYTSYDSVNQLYGKCSCRLDLLRSSLKLGELVKADSLIKFSAECYSVPDNDILIGLHMIQSQIDSDKGKLVKASEELKKVLILKYKMLAPVQYYETYQQLGQLVRDQGFADSSYKIMSYSALWFEERGLRLRAYEAYNNLASWYESDQKIALAFEANKKATIYKNLLVDEADMEIFDDLRYKYQTQTLENKLQEEVEKGNIQKKQLLIMLILSVLLAVIVVMSLVFVSMTRKKAVLLKLLAEEKEAKSTEEIKTRKLAMEQIKVENELSKQKAAANKLLAEKKDQELLLNALRRSEIMSFQKEMFAHLLPFVTKFNRKTDRDAFEALLKDFRNESENDPMSQFEAVFKQAYGDFYNRLVEIAPDLSRAEIQVAVLLRLNLTSKEIAHILSLTTATIERTRHQLRQKLNLEPNQQLVAWLIGLG